jgi:hypothetical protein
LAERECGGSNTFHAGKADGTAASRKVTRVSHATLAANTANPLNLKDLQQYRQAVAPSQFSISFLTLQAIANAWRHCKRHFQHNQWLDSIRNNWRFLIAETPLKTAFDAT